MSQPNQLPLIAELRETLFQLGMMRNRCVALSSENYEMNERNKALDQDNQMLRQQVIELQAEEKTSQDKIDSLQTELAEVGEHS